MSPTWKWAPQSATYANYGNANQWTVNAGLASLARESTQNSNDARVADKPTLHFAFTRLTGTHRDKFLRRIGWSEQLEPHLRAMSDEATGAVAAGNIRAGLDSLRSSESLLLLSISDYGCRGLTGPEFSNINSADYGNFIKLCRLDLFSGKDEAAGGSFGLGKAVYWRFSSVQTVLFNSSLAPADAVDGRTRNRLFGVNQGVAHRLGSSSFEGRGYFGVPDSNGDIASTWGKNTLVDELFLGREDDRPGTTALLLGFHDPDDPQKGTDGIESVKAMADELRAGVEENFWPMLARKRMEVVVSVADNAAPVSRVTVDPEENYTELVRALRRFDNADLDEKLDETYSVISRDIPIEVPRRKSNPQHGKFVHNAKLVLTLSDEQQDTLENKVCLFRAPEMIVETIDREFENHTYHGFLLVGGAIDPTQDDPEARMADDFLRFAEPPAHDRWLPRRGRTRTSQSSLNAHYIAPWVPSLRKIEDLVLGALHETFGAPPPQEGKPPEAVFRNLRFLAGDPGPGGSRTSVTPQPTVEITDWSTADGRWRLGFTVKARNRSEGWSLTPVLSFIGLDGRATDVAWESLVSDEASIRDGRIVIAGKGKSRFVKASFLGVSRDDLPIPAEDAMVDVVLRDIEPSGGEVGRS